MTSTSMPTSLPPPTPALGMDRGCVVGVDCRPGRQHCSECSSGGPRPCLSARLAGGCLDRQDSRTSCSTPCCRVQGFYAVYTTLFTKLAEQEQEFGAKKPSAKHPGFGAGAETPWCTSHALGFFLLGGPRARQAAGAQRGVQRWNFPNPWATRTPSLAWPHPLLQCGGPVALRIHRAPSPTPPAGSSNSEWAEVNRFYNAWGGFSTGRTFAWVDEYNPASAPNRQARRCFLVKRGIGGRGEGGPCKSSRHGRESRRACESTVGSPLSAAPLGSTTR